MASLTAPLERGQSRHLGCRLGIAGPQLHHLLVVGESLLDSALCGEDAGEIEVRVGVVEIQLERAIVSVDRLVEPAEPVKGNAQPVERLGHVALERTRPTS
jgi:hypothetical protein